jgi:hypothetical protein
LLRGGGAVSFVSFAEDPSSYPPLVIGMGSGEFEYQLATEDCCFIENVLVTKVKH